MAPGNAPTANPDESVPNAALKPQRRVSLAWIVPVIALVAVGYLAWRAWHERGIEITITFDQAHGLKVGDPVRFRGASVGEVRDILLADDLGGLRVKVRLERDAERLAQQGTRFWIVRPQVGFEGAAGLDTIVGPRYIMASAPRQSNSSPGQHNRVTEFTGLAEPPLVEQEREGDLEITLHAPNRGSLSPGGPLLYRQFRIGTIASVDLAPNAESVVARVCIEARYAPLIRENTRFWDVGGYTARLGWRGLSFEVDSIQTLMTGGVALATPPLDEAGARVTSGTRFSVAPEPEKDWLEWEPMIALGAAD